MRSFKGQRGEGEAGFFMALLAGAIVISVGYYTINWIFSIKEARTHYGEKKPQEGSPPPKTLDDMGEYDVTY